VTNLGHEPPWVALTSRSWAVNLDDRLRIALRRISDFVSSDKIIARPTLVWVWQILA
jgi:hypothetical protein